MNWKKIIIGAVIITVISWMTGCSNETPVPEMDSEGQETMLEETIIEEEIIY